MQAAIMLGFATLSSLSAAQKVVVSVFSLFEDITLPMVVASRLLDFSFSHQKWYQMLCANKTLDLKFFCFRGLLNQFTSSSFQSITPLCVNKLYIRHLYGITIVHVTAIYNNTN